MSFFSPLCGDVGPPFMATLNLPRLTIGLPVWLFSNPVIPNASFVSNPGPLLHEHQPHVNPSPSSSNVELTSLSSSSTIEKSEINKRVGNKKTKRKVKKKNIKKKSFAPTSNLHVGIPPATGHHPGSIDVPLFILRKTKFPCRLCKGDHLLKDCPSLSLVSHVWST